MTRYTSGCAFALLLLSSFPLTSPAQTQVTLQEDLNGYTGAQDTKTNVTLPGTIRFAVLGDYGSAGTAEANVASEVNSWAADFVITVGDNNYPNGLATTIDQNIGQYFSDFIFPYAGSYSSTATENRFFPTLGNHDWHSISCGGGSCSGAYFDYFTLPPGQGDERYYEFVWGDVHFFAIDSDTGEPDGTSETSTQAQWLQARLAASTAEWKVVYFHHAAYSSSSSHGSTTGMQWPFAAWGADVVMGGHDHTYERIFQDGIVYYVNGLGGRSIYEIGTPIAGSQVLYNGDYGAMRVDANATSMTVEFVTRTGLVVDSYTLNKGGPTSPVAEFVATPLTGAAPLQVAFTDQSTNSPTSWNWDFGDTVTSNQQNPSHTYSAAGLYTISLTATNADGGDVETKVDYINVWEPSSTIDHLAASQSIRYGSSSGSVIDTEENGGGELKLTEVESNGKASKRRSRLEVTWTFSVRSGLPATFFANAWTPPSTDGDEFRFSMSTDGSTFSPMFDLTEASDGDVYQSHVLGPIPTSTLWVRLEDTNRDQGHRTLDMASIDHMYVRTETSTDPAPDAPVLTAIAAGSSQIDLDWTDVGTELGYRIEFSDDGGTSYSEIDVVAANVTSYSDEGLTGSTTYFYRVVAFNAGGSTDSNSDSATTGPPPTAVDVHLADLTGSSSGSKKWNATVSPLVHDSAHSVVAGVQVNGSWSGWASGLDNCTTDASGTCEMSVSLRPKDASVTFTVSSLGGTGFNHDTDLDHPGVNPVVVNSPSSGKTGIASAEIPERLELRQNYPNPFNPTTVIEYGLPESQHVSVSVYNALGVEVTRLEDGVQSAGWHQVRFDGKSLSSGMYMAVVRSGTATLTRTMLLAK